jgi:predicted porin
MQKKIIALAIASALTAPVMAYAEATAYGQANLSIDIINDGMTNSGNSNNLVSNESRLGLKGSEDLGNGMSAVWQMEGNVGMDTGATTAAQLFNRNTYLGLSSASMGTVLAGRHDTPYKMATRKLDVFADTIAADNRGLAGVAMMGTGHDIRWSNILAYMSPSMSGFSVAAATVFGAENAASGQTKGTGYSLAGMYDQGPIYAALAYDSVKLGNVGDLGTANAATFGVPGAAVDDTAKALKLGFGYTMDAFAVNAVIEKPKFAPAVGASSSSTNLYLAGKFSISSTDAVKLAFTKRGSTTGFSNDAKQIAVGYDHNLSANTTVYALATKITDNTTGAADPRTLSVGMKHSF